ncbi:MAG: putative selenium-dependent hydroxylase accessory protein YqeC [Spirochaetaceae bacterium]|nr:putative selenium-dependent hydroxylase accessory protein YqeC [Spirochaetaceae bacterium]
MQLLNKIDEMIFNPELKNNVIAITGGGGKTTTMIALGEFYKTKGYSVLLSTTTKVQSPRFFDFKVDYIFFEECDFFMHEPVKGESVVFVEQHIMNPKKSLAPRDEILPLISKKYDVTILEADGARCLPLKKHRACDPVIPKNVTSVIAIAGMSSFNHSAANFCMGEDDMSLVVDKNYLQLLIDSSEGLLKRIESYHKSIILFNQSDLINTKDIEILKNIKSSSPIILGSIKENKVY